MYTALSRLLKAVSLHKKRHWWCIIVHHSGHTTLCKLKLCFSYNLMSSSSILKISIFAKCLLDACKLGAYDSWYVGHIKISI